MSFKQYGGLSYTQTHHTVGSTYLHCKQNTSNDINVNKMLFIDSINNITPTTFSYLQDASSNIQTQLNVLEETLYDLSSNVDIINYTIQDLSYNIDEGTTEFDGKIQCVSISCVSDYRIKSNVVPLVLTNPTIDQLRPVSYYNTTTNKQDFGFIAHELQEVYPFMVNGQKDGKHVQSIQYMSLIALLVKEIQLLKKDMAILQATYRD